jgi:hypothetical protein
MRVLRAISALCGGALAVILLSVPHFAGAATDITLSNPQSGGTIVNTSAQITGTAPANTIVRVTITDAVPNRPNVAHIKGGKVSGVATSDKNGQWIYVPTILVPGQYTVQASFTGENNKMTQTGIVPFVIVDKEGNSYTAAVSLQRLIVLGLMAFAVLLFAYIFIVVRRNGGHFISREAELIEHEFEHAHEEIEALHKRLLQDEKDYQNDKTNERNQN